MDTNVDEQIRNQQISLNNSLCITPSSGVDVNHSRGAFCVFAEQLPI